MCNPDVGAVSPIQVNSIWGIIFYVQSGSDESNSESYRALDDPLTVTRVGVGF